MTRIRKAIGRGVALSAMFALPMLASACRKSSEAGGEVSRNWKPAAPKAVLNVDIGAVKTALEQRLEEKPPARIDGDQWRHVRALYKQFGGVPLWLSADGVDKPRVKALTDALLAANTDGMRMEDYPISEVAQAIAAVREGRTRTAEEVADADVVLTSAFTALSEDMLRGQVDPKTVGQSWHIDPQEERVDSALARTIRADELDRGIAEMRPEIEDYEGLRKELERYRQIVNQGGWPQVPNGKPVKPGARDDAARLAALRERLRIEGLLASDSAAAAAPAPAADTQAGARTPGAASTRSVYDRALAGAVAHYQARHAIVVDSMLGPETVQSLNVPADYRLAQIAANLERFRWLPRLLGDRYIFVNVPGFRLDAYEGGRKVLDMKVIVGQDYEDRATPVFADSMETVVFRPYWLVTPDIQRKELAPKIAANPGYMAEHNYEYYRDGGQTRIRQRPGGENSLGLVKFLFPNDFNIYLHDTPQRELFKKDVRAFSHGCIRVEGPTQLAQWALGWDAARVERAMHGEDNRTVRLPKKIPVYITYATAYIKDGQLHFGNDLYRRDDAIVSAVQSGAMPSAQTVAAVQALRRIAEAS